MNIQIPSLMDARNVLCIQPHPDDIDIACGGTVAKLADAGTHITYLTVTDGSAGTPIRRDGRELAQVRRNEQGAAGQVLGVQSFRWLDYDDAGVIDEFRLQNDLIQAIRELRPDTVITLDPWLPYEAHPAHRAVGLAAAAAVLFSGLANIAPNDQLPTHTIARVAFAFTARPNTFIDVTATWSRKLAAIRFHESQFPDAIWPFYQEYLTIKGMQYGAKVQADRGEALKVLTPLHLHCNVDAEAM